MTVKKTRDMRSNRWGNIKSQRDLKVWQEAMDAAIDIFEVTKSFPVEERYSLVDQMRRSSRSVASNVSEAWRKRRYEAAFKSKMSDSEAEACETQTWIELSLRCKYIDEKTAKRLDQRYEIVMSKIVVMIKDSKKWTINAPPER